MRINDLNLNRAADAPSTEKTGQNASQRLAENQQGVKGTDQAEVSNLAQSLSAADPGRIEELRLQVQSGSYNVSAETVANAIIDAHLE